MRFQGDRMLLLQIIYHQRGEASMAQGILPFQYEFEKKPGGMTALAGLPLFVEFAYLMGLQRLIEGHVWARRGDKGWTDDQMIMALVLLNLAGGDCVDDLRVVEGDEGFCRVLREFEFYGRDGIGEASAQEAVAQTTHSDVPVFNCDAWVSQGPLLA
jgi:hypothetical protein